MANFEVLSLDPTTPQIRAPGAGDGYSVPRDMTFATGTTLNAPTTVVSVNTSTDALRITQVGSGNALLVEDSANPDASPTVVTATGAVGIGTASPLSLLDVSGTAPVLTLNDSRASATWSAGTALGKLDFYTSDVTGIGAHSVASIGVVAGGSNTASPDGVLVFSTGAYNSVATEKMRLDSSGNLGIGATPSASQTWVAGSNTQKVVAVTEGATNSLMQLKGYRAAVSGNGILVLAKSRGATIGTETATSSGDSLGAVSFEGVNSSNTAAGSSYILGAQDGAAGATYVPGRLQFYTSDGTNAPAERARIDSSGNVGLGVTPSAWGDSANNSKAIQFSSGSVSSYRTERISIGLNNFFDGTNFKYTNNGTASYYQQFAGSHLWFTAASGTAGNNITFTQAMTLNASGRLGIKQTSPTVDLDVGANDNTVAALSVRYSSVPVYLSNSFDGTSGLSTLSVNSYNTSNGSASWSAFQNTSYGNAAVQIASNVGSADIRFLTAAAANTNPTERARITAAGELLVGVTSATANGGVIQVSNGITFPATQSASSNANTLDDYEEGTWTPAFTFDVGGGGVVYGTRSGRYTKIGNLVYLDFVLTVSSGLSAADYYLRLSGLPFNTANVGNTIGRVWIQNPNSASFNLSVQGGDSSMLCYTTNAAADFADGSDVNGVAISGAFSYRV